MKQWDVGQDSAETVLTAIRRIAANATEGLVVCFDYFDTVVTRTVEPEFTKEMASTRLAQLLKYRFTGDHIYRQRKSIEQELCRRNYENRGELEFSFADLCQHLYRRLGTDNEPLTIEGIDRFHRTMLDIEVAVETQVQRLCPHVGQLLEGLAAEQFTLVLLSDFYLPEPEFRYILQWHKREHLFSRIYISSTCGKSKGSGRLFPMVCEDLEVAPGQMLMIGDNEHADIKMAEQRGMQALLVVRQCEEMLPGSQAWKRSRERPAGKDLYRTITFPRGLLFAELGISLWLFTHRLFEALWNDDCKDVFFLSKEGEFLKTLFERYQVELFGSPKIRSHYLLASRKSTFIASLDSLESETFHRLLNHYRDLSIREFLGSLNFAESDVVRVCTALGEDCDKRRHMLKHDPVFHRLLKLEPFQACYEAYRQTQKKRIIDYLDIFEVDYRIAGLYLVDVGWKGSIQDNLYYILEKKVSTQGYYIGSLQATNRSLNNRKNGLLFDDYPIPSAYLKVYNNNRSLFEMMLGASHGSADWYTSTQAVLCDQADPGGNKGGKGLVGGICQSVITKDIAEERHLFDTVIKPWQEQVLELSCRLNYAYMTEGRMPSSAWFAKHHGRAVFLPTVQEIDFFEGLYHYENFGIFKVTEFRAEQSFSLLERLVHLKNIIFDPPVLETGVWPPIILRRFGVGFWRFFDGKYRYFKEFKTLKKNKVHKMK